VSLSYRFPDDGPRYDLSSQGIDSLIFQGGLSAYRLGEINQARAVFQKLIATMPQSRLAGAAASFLAELPAAEGGPTPNWVATVAAYRTIMRDYPRSPDSARAAWKIADLYFAQGWYHEARGAYEHALTLTPPGYDTERSLLGLALTLQALGKWKEAGQVLESVRSRTANETLLTRATIEAAMVLARQNRSTEALSYFEIAYHRWLDSFKRDSDALLAYGTILRSLRRWEQARDVFLLFHNLYPDAPDAPLAWLYVGDACQAIGARPCAGLFYAATSAAHPGTPADTMARMRLLQLHRESTEAQDLSQVVHRTVQAQVRMVPVHVTEPEAQERLLRSFAAEYADNAVGSEALYRLGQHYESRHEWSNALHAYQETEERLGRYPEDPWPEAAGEHLVRLLRPWLEAAVRAEDDLSAVTLFHRHGAPAANIYGGTSVLLFVADAHRRLGLSAEAGRLYQHVLRHPQGAKFIEPALIGLCRVYLDQHDPQAARKVIERYRLQFPTGDYAREAIELHLVALEREGDRAGTIRMLQQWVKSHPRDDRRAQMLLRLGETFAAVHNDREAVRAYEEAIKSNALCSNPTCLGYAEVLRRQGHIQRASAIYEQVLRSQPTPEETEWVRLRLARIATDDRTADTPAKSRTVYAIKDPLLQRIASAFQTNARLSRQYKGDPIS
jgi:tetratricopeptide (TPR) repeat protein